MGIARDESKIHQKTCFKSVLIFALEQTLLPFVAWQKPVMGLRLQLLWSIAIWADGVYKKSIKQSIGIKTQEMSLC